MKRIWLVTLPTLALLLFSGMVTAETQSGKMVQDAEYYVLEAQNGERWAKEDEAIDKKLDELKKQFGTPPNIIHIMWDDTAFGDVGIPAIQKVRGLDTPNLNTLAEEGSI